VHIVSVVRYLSILVQPIQPYQIAVYKLFSRRAVTACYFGIIIVGCFIFATAANWLFHAVTVNLSAASKRGTTSSQQVGELTEVDLNYGVVIDCGSSGSRVFVYCWPPHTGQPHQLLNIRLLRDDNGNPAVMKTEPGKLHFVCCIIIDLTVCSVCRIYESFCPYSHDFTV